MPTPGRLTSIPVTQQSLRPTATATAAATAAAQPEVNLAAQPSASTAALPTAEQATQPTTQTSAHSEVPPVVTAQAQPASSKASASKIDVPETLSVDKKTGGSEKLWVCPEGSSVGWLQPHAFTDAAVMTRESDTIKTLAGLGFPVAKIIEGAPPTSITTGSGNVPVSSSGFWLEKVDSVANGKPKRLGGPFGGDEAARSLVKDLEKGGVDLGAVRTNLKSLHDRADVLSQHVGELDLYFGKDGQVKLLDVAPGPKGSVLADDSVAAEQAKTGLKRMMAIIDETVPASPSAATAGHADRLANRG